MIQSDPMIPCESIGVCFQHEALVDSALEPFQSQNSMGFQHVRRFSFLYCQEKTLWGAFIVIFIHLLHIRKSLHSNLALDWLVFKCFVVLLSDIVRSFQFFFAGGSPVKRREQEPKDDETEPFSTRASNQWGAMLSEGGPGIEKNNRNTTTFGNSGYFLDIFVGILWIPWLCLFVWTNWKGYEPVRKFIGKLGQELNLTGTWLDDFCDLVSLLVRCRDSTGKTFPKLHEVGGRHKICVTKSNGFIYTKDLPQLYTQWNLTWRHSQVQNYDLRKSSNQ